MDIFVERVVRRMDQKTRACFVTLVLLALLAQVLNLGAVEVLFRVL